MNTFPIAPTPCLIPPRPATFITFAPFKLFYFTAGQIADLTKQDLFGFNGDYDRDGIPNFMEYLFGLHPTVFGPDFLAAIIRNGLYSILLLTVSLALAAAIDPRFFLRYRGEVP